ncbi:hypothetical protein ACYFX5_08905 [Bremerella sp. T1]|uniref:hypothetical protein n=1 Tax=Bremerella sp. TYQ1 TaxID=3119568 RepID=UPI001CC9C24E|nr:hypothetical protein [Bremerella volcania]UBM38373.1 hypothetical protein LA756_10835 [Bremerella volcania]
MQNGALTCDPRKPLPAAVVRRVRLPWSDGFRFSCWWLDGPSLTVYKPETVAGFREWQYKDHPSAEFIDMLLIDFFRAVKLENN